MQTHTHTHTNFFDTSFKTHPTTSTAVNLLLTLCCLDIPSCCALGKCRSHTQYQGLLYSQMMVTGDQSPAKDDKTLSTSQMTSASINAIQHFQSQKEIS